MTLAEKIKSRRKELHLTQGEVAEKVGVATQTIYKYETGIVTNMPLERLERLAKALDVTAAYLMGWTDDENSTDYKKEDATADIFIRLRTDSVFYEAVQKLHNLSPTKLQGVISMLSSFEQD